MILSTQTRRLIVSNMGDADHETIWLARDIFAALTDTKGKPLNPKDGAAVRVIRQAIDDYEKTSLNDINKLVRF
jgi:hypothetical protein